MISSNKSMILCLFAFVGLALVVCEAAEIPTTVPQPQDDLFYGEEDAYDLDMDDSFEDDDYDMGLDDSLEEDLAELSEEHFEVKQDCDELAQMIADAKSNLTATVDPELQQAYDQCKQDLGDISSEMRELTQEILGRE